MELSPVSSGQHLDGFEAPIVKSAESLKVKIEPEAFLSLLSTMDYFILIYI